MLENHGAQEAVIGDRGGSVFGAVTDARAEFNVAKERDAVSCVELAEVAAKSITSSRRHHARVGMCDLHLRALLAADLPAARPDRRSISRFTYQAAFSKSWSPFFSSARQIYFMGLPRLKFMCSTTSIHSTPEG